MELYRSSVRSSTEALYGVLLKLYTELYRSSIQSSTVASLSSLPSPPFRLCRRLPFVSAVASLCSSAVVARAPLVIYPLKTRHHDATTTPQPTIPLQPVCYHAADDHHNPNLYHNQSAAVTLRTTTATPTFTTTSLLLSRRGRLLQPLPLPQTVCCYHAVDDHCNTYLYHNQSATIKLRTTTTTPTFTATSLQLSRCKKPLHHRRTAGVPRAHCRHTTDTPQIHRRRRQQ